MSVAMHAPGFGLVRASAWRRASAAAWCRRCSSNRSPAPRQEVAEGSPATLDTATPDEIIAAIQEAGVVGLGGAAFPTHVKLKIPEDKYVDTLIINGVECEPFLTTDHRVMLEQQRRHLHGHPLPAQGHRRRAVIIGVEANKPDAAELLRRRCPRLAGPVEVLQVKYPQGAEKMLITALLGREVPSGGLPSDVHALCVNVATTAEIGRLLPHGRGIQERVITIAGPGGQAEGQLPHSHRHPAALPARARGRRRRRQPRVSGRADDGAAAPAWISRSPRAPRGHGLHRPRPSGRTVRVYPCIRCGYCVDACPIFLNPSQLGMLAETEQYERMAEEHNLMDCFECGSCSFVCPSHIPLVQQFRVAKAAVRKAGAA